MKSAFERILASQKGVLGFVLGLGALVGAAVGVIQALQSAFLKLPSVAARVTVGGIVLLALALSFLLGVAARRRSVLRRPERLIFSVDDPRQWVGREAETARILETCERRSLVWLVGESGVGKSTVARGLVEACLARQEVNGVQGLLAIRLDVSSLPWGNGLKAALSRALMSIPTGGRRLLGDSGDEEPVEPFGWLARLSSSARRRLLIIVDQFDDYAFVHRDRFFQGMASITPAELERASGEWAELARGIREGRFHVLMVCRSDAVLALRAVEFVSATSCSLPRIAPEWAGRVLDEITSDDGAGAVVDEPERGWLQLKGRLLRDLAADTGRILPVQFVVCVECLRRLKFLTPKDYLSTGGVRGLERLHVERHVEDAAMESSAAKGAVLAGLALLLSEDGCKTQYVTRSKFRLAVFPDREETPALRRLIDYLVRWHIIRRQYVNGNEYFLLHHDYLARGIREACRQANYWPQLLREQARDFSEALGWTQRWRALSPLHAQIGIVWEWARGRLSYREHTRFAAYSLLRAVPPAMAGVALCALAHWVGHLRMQASVDHVYAVLPTQMNAGFPDPRRPYGRWYWDPVQGDSEWRVLVDGGPELALAVIERGLEQAALTPTLQMHSELLAHLAVGLDPTGRRSERLVTGVLLPTLADGHPGARAVAAGLLGYVELSRADVEKLMVLVKQEVDKGADFTPLPSLLGHLAPLLTASERQDILSRILVRLRENSRTQHSMGAFEQRYRWLMRLALDLSTDSSADGADGVAMAVAQSIPVRSTGWSLMDLPVELVQVDLKNHPQTMRVTADLLIDRLAASSTRPPQGFVWAALARIRGMGNTHCAQRILRQILERIDTETNPETLWQMVNAFVSADTDVASVHVVLQALLRRIQGCTDAHSLQMIDTALRRLSVRLSDEDRSAAADVWLHRALAESDRQLALICWQALAALPPRFERDTAKLATIALLKHVMPVGGETSKFKDYCEVMAALSPQLETSELVQAAATLLREAGAARDLSPLIDAGRRLECLGPKSGTAVLPATDGAPLQTAADVVLEQLARETDERTMGFEVAMLASISSRLTADTRHGIVAIIAKRMAVAERPLERNVYCLAIKRMSGWLDSSDRVILANTLYHCLLSESEGYILVKLVDALSAVDRPEHLFDLSEVQTSLGRHIETELSDSTLCDLARASAELGPREYGVAAHPAVRALAARLLRASDSLDLAHVYKALTCLGPDVRAADVRPAMDLLAGRIRATWDFQTLQGLTEAWCILEHIADADLSVEERVQRYVELLNLPLTAGLQQRRLLQGLETVTGARFGGDLWNFLRWRESSGPGALRSHRAML